MKKFIFFFMICMNMAFGEDDIIPLIPLIPAQKKEDIEKDPNLQKRTLEKVYTVMMENKIKIFTPLEILSDIDIEALVLGDESVTIPFEIEMNKTPEKKDWYKLNYSQNSLDIDGDGQMDTFIYSPKYINTKIVTDNSVVINGSKISKDGTYNKNLYITITANDN